MGKERVCREQHLLRPRGKSEQNAFRKWIYGYSLRERGQRREATRDRAGELGRSQILVGHELRLHPGDSGHHEGCERMMRSHLCSGVISLAATQTTKGQGQKLGRPMRRPLLCPGVQ